jgi:hypothetical protein
MKTAALTAALMLAAGSAYAGGPFDEDCRHTAPRKTASPAAGVTKVVIRGESGSLKVDGTNGVSQITATGTACTSDEDFLDRITLTARRVGSELHIEANIPEKTVVFGFWQARLDFAVTLPAGLPVRIDDDSGWLKVSNTGALDIDDDSGSIEVRNIRGNVQIDDDSGEIVIEGVNGNVQISDDSGSIEIRSVTGAVEIEDDSGSIQVERVASLHIRNDDSGSITVAHVRGNVIIDDDGSGAVDVADIGGNFTVAHKGSGSIDYTRVAGKVDIPERHRR